MNVRCKCLGNQGEGRQATGREPPAHSTMSALEGNARGPNKGLLKGEKAPRSISWRKAGGIEVTIQNQVHWLKKKIPPSIPEKNSPKSMKAMKRAKKLLPPSKSHLSFPVTSDNEKASQGRYYPSISSEALISGLFKQTGRTKESDTGLQPLPEGQGIFSCTESEPVLEGFQRSQPQRGLELCLRSRQAEGH